MRTIYKICPASAWREAERQGVFRGSPVDVSDGYIHFSTASQVEETARKHFAGQTGLVLLRLDTAALGAALKWEPSRGGALFPHLYGPLPCGLVETVTEIALGADGAPQLGDLEA